MRSAPLLAFSLLGACNGNGPNLDGLAEAFLLVALVVAAAAVLVTFLGFRAVRGLWSALRDARQAEAGPAPAVRAWWLALFLTAIYFGVVMVASEFSFADTDLARRLLIGSLVPVAIVVCMAAVAARRRVRWPLLVTAPMLVAWAPLLVEAWQQRGLSELPARVQQLADGGQHACARLSTGRVACVGVNWEGQRGDGSEHGNDAPTLVRGITDAQTLVVGSTLGCVLRSEHAATCWGGDPALPVPGERRVPWLLPGGADAVALAATHKQVVMLTASGELRGWPEALPAGIVRARRLVGHDDIDGGWFCAVDPDEVLVCWSTRQPATVKRLTPPPVVELAIDADVRVVCASDADDTVRCFSVETGTLTRTLELPGLRQLVAAGDGSFCALAGGRVTCWQHSHWPGFQEGSPHEVPALTGVDRIFGAGGRVCGERAGATRCHVLGETAARDVATLLARDPGVVPAP